MKTFLRYIPAIAITLFLPLVASALSCTWNVSSTFSGQVPYGVVGGINYTLIGGGGGGSGTGGTGYIGTNGATVTGTFTANVGDTLTVYVGGGGGSGADGGGGGGSGWYGGGAGTLRTGGGGGSTAILDNGTVVQYASGGNGGPEPSGGEVGGYGGSNVGGAAATVITNNTAGGLGYGGNGNMTGSQLAAGGSGGTGGAGGHIYVTGSGKNWHYYGGAGGGGGYGAGGGGGSFNDTLKSAGVSSIVGGNGGSNGGAGTAGANGAGGAGSSNGAAGGSWSGGNGGSAVLTFQALSCTYVAISQPTATITSSRGSSMQVGGPSSNIYLVATPGSGDTVQYTYINQSFNGGAQTNVLEASGPNDLYVFTPSTAGTYVFYGWAYTAAYPYWYPTPNTNVTVTVTATPTCSVTLSANTINAGQSINVSYTSVNANAADGMVISTIGPVLANTNGGPIQVTPANTTTYTCTVWDSSNNPYTYSPASATVTINQPPMCTIAVAPSTIQKYSSATLTYHSQNVTSFSITPSIGTVTQNATATASVSPTATTTYTGSVSGPGGNAQCTAPTNATSTLSIACTPVTTYTCNGLTTIIQTATSTACVVTTNSNYASCSSPGYCVTGDGYCYYSSPDFIPIGPTSGNLTLHPSLITKGGKIHVFWNVLSGSALSCGVTGTNGDSWSSLSSSATGMLSSTINQQTTYTLSCLNDDGVTYTTQTQTVNIVPTYQER